MKLIPKTITFFYLTAITLLSLVAQPAMAATEQHRVMLEVDNKLASVNGRAQFLEEPLLITEKSMSIPFHFISTAFLCETDWNPHTKTAYITRGNMQIAIRPGQSYATVNDRRVPLSVPARIKDGTTFIPLRFLSDVMGAQIDWNSKSRTVTIIMNIYKHPETGINFIYPSGLTIHNEESKLVRFTGPGETALEIRKIDSPGIDLSTIKEIYAGANIIHQSEQELWVSRGKLVLLNKLITKDRENFLITYGTAADRFEETGRNEYELIVNTLQIS